MHKGQSVGQRKGRMKQESKRKKTQWRSLAEETERTFEANKGAHQREGERYRLFCEALVARVLSGETIRLTGVGVFSLRTRKRRKIRNPATHEIMEIPPTTRIHFRESK